MGDNVIVAVISSNIESVLASYGYCQECHYQILPCVRSFEIMSNKIMCSSNHLYVALHEIRNYVISVHKVLSLCTLTESIGHKINYINDI